MLFSRPYLSIKWEFLVTGYTVSILESLFYAAYLKEPYWIRDGVHNWALDFRENYQCCQNFMFNLPNTYQGEALCVFPALGICAAQAHSKFLRAVKWHWAHPLTRPSLWKSPPSGPSHGSLEENAPGTTNPCFMPGKPLLCPLLLLFGLRFLFCNYCLILKILNLESMWVLWTELSAPIVMWWSPNQQCDFIWG